LKRFSTCAFLLLLASLACLASAGAQTVLPQSPSSGIPADGSAAGDADQAPAGQWAVECNVGYCLLSTDVLIADANHPADPQHLQYMSIIVEMSRADRKPVSFAFGVPPDADRKQGVLIDFARSVKKGGKWDIVLDEDGMSQLDFTHCEKEFCMARVHSQILDSNGKLAMDLLETFLHKDFVLLLFTRNGVAYRGMHSLTGFQTSYQRLMETNMKAPAQ